MWRFVGVICRTKHTNRKFWSTSTPHRTKTTIRVTSRHRPGMSTFAEAVGTTHTPEPRGATHATPESAHGHGADASGPRGRVHKHRCPVCAYCSRGGLPTMATHTADGEKMRSTKRSSACKHERIQIKFKNLYIIVWCAFSPSHAVLTADNMCGLVAADRTFITRET